MLKGLVVLLTKDIEWVMTITIVLFLKMVPIDLVDVKVKYENKRE
jgi:hypothetical protein